MVEVEGPEVLTAFPSAAARERAVRTDSARRSVPPVWSVPAITLPTRGIPRLIAAKLRGSVIKDLCSSASSLSTLSARRVRRRSVKLRRWRDMRISQDDARRERAA